MTPQPVARGRSAPGVRRAVGHGRRRQPWHLSRHRRRRRRHPAGAAPTAVGEGRRRRGGAGTRTGSAWDGAVQVLAWERERERRWREGRNGQKSRRENVARARARGGATARTDLGSRRRRPAAARAQSLAYVTPCAPRDAPRRSASSTRRRAGRRGCPCARRLSFAGLLVAYRSKSSSISPTRPRCPPRARSAPARALTCPGPHRSCAASDRRRRRNRTSRPARESPRTGRRQPSQPALRRRIARLDNLLPKWAGSAPDQVLHRRCRLSLEAWWLRRRSTDGRA